MWFRLDDVFHAHPKVLQAGNAATGLWVRCATYSACYKLDGRVPAQVAVGYAGELAEVDALCESGLWLPNGHGFVIRDFLQHNPSAAELAERRIEQAEGKRRWPTTRIAPGSSSASCTCEPPTTGRSWFSPPRAGSCSSWRRSSPSAGAADLGLCNFTHIRIHGDDGHVCIFR